MVICSVPKRPSVVEATRSCWTLVYQRNDGLLAGHLLAMTSANVGRGVVAVCGVASRRWCYSAAKGTNVKHSIAAHVYMSISYWGATNIKCVTGIHKQPSKFVSAKTKHLHAGVAGDEYTEVLRLG